MAGKQPSLWWGCLVSELGAVGAGKPGWLDDAALVAAMGRDLVAIARQRSLVVTPWSGAHSSAPRASGFSIDSIPAATGADPSYRITALEWLFWEGWSVLAVGTSLGILCFYSEIGDLLIKQSFNVGSICNLHVRCNQNKRDTAEELSVAFQSSIARIDALDLQSQLRRRLLEVARNSTLERQLIAAESTKLSYQVWSVKSSGSSICVDAAITGVLPPALFEQQSRERYFCAVTIGSDSTLAAFRLSEDRRKSLTELLFNKVVPATVSRITSFAKAFRRNSEPVQEARPAEVKAQEFSRASLITALKDSPRKGESLALSPTCSLAAVTDSLGRVLLVDVHALVVVRLWKGYRDAHCKFLEAPLNGSSGLQHRSSCVKEDFSLCLAIHAPRRAVVEVWQLRNGPRLSVIHCSESCRLLQPPSQFWSSDRNDHEEESYSPKLVFLLKGDSGLLSLINPFMDQ
ncbi:hypothetical protein SELMODRAFT_119185 [Selaginella moellendorffii]|uniref:Rab3-GAP regulatory subunit N-terminal domain-containing protein n=1 Tax=Selaginella moellendorffii TaxID=88036 RepID=D8SKT2_SELML|nr:rab3 GTPase-activating protein non-catalytic subunit [Selaginella moellendorffii]EFJ15035.1 hypothetical protein SELMODRAFT_119185 [Selaginella moellendorffii]|eukprot:XP_002984023.1 rab3 GTPase-activating protein non-catalytic subunit [Selaginella moellendorffii]